jgi:hypothetical protein
MTDKVNDPRRVTLKNVRLSFSESLLHKKKTSNTEDAKLAHSCNLILEADSPNFAENRDKCRAALDAACADKWEGQPKKWQEISEDNRKRVCFRRGETFKNQTTGEVYEGYAGNLAIAGKGPKAGQQRPSLLDRGKRMLKDQAPPEVVKAGRTFDEDSILDIFYSGTACDAVVSFYGTEKGGHGVFCSIEAIRSRQEGERVAGGFDVDPDVFEDLDDDDGFMGGDSGSSTGTDDDDGLGGL